MKTNAILNKCCCSSCANNLSTFQMRPKQQADFQVTIVVKVDRKSLENAKYKIQSNH